MSDSDTIPNPDHDVSSDSSPPTATPAIPSIPILTPAEARVLGSLIEKEITTPEYYPLTLNALTAACNQKSNRDPVMALTNNDVQQALDTLRYRHQLASRVQTAGSRTDKYRHTLSNRFQLSSEQTAVLCELLLRGPETVGELRGRAARLFPFDNLQAVEQTLTQLRDAPEFPLVALLAREPGRRESRHMHLLCGPPAMVAHADDLDTATRPVAPSRLDNIESAINDLREKFEQIQVTLEDLKRQ